MTRSGRRTRLWIGLVLVIFGALFLLDNLTGWNFPRGILWPVILIAVGVTNLVRRGSPGWVGGLITLLGVVFLLDALDVVTFHMRDVWRFWPVLLLVVGARILFGGPKRRSSRASLGDTTARTDSGDLDVTHVFGGGKVQVTSRSFSGGTATAVFGSADIDLRQASVADGGATIDLTVLFGGAKLRIPYGWAVDVQTTHFLGDVEDKRTGSAGSGGGERINITGICMFGSVVIES